MIGLSGVTRADMAKTVEHAEFGKNAAADGNVFDQGSINTRWRNSRRLRSGLGEEQHRKRKDAAEPRLPCRSCAAGHRQTRPRRGSAAGTTARCPRENGSTYPATPR